MAPTGAMPLLDRHHGGKLFRYDPAAGKHEQCYQGTLVGGFTIQSDGTLLIPPGSQPGRLYRLDTDGKLDIVLDDIGISNGLGFTIDRGDFIAQTRLPVPSIFLTTRRKLELE